MHIVIDMQNDFLTGALKNEEACNIVANIADELGRAIKKGETVCFTRDTHRRDTYADTMEGTNNIPIHCILYSSGWDIVEPLKQITSGRFVFNKSGLAVQFDSTKLKYDFEECDEVHIYGVYTDTAVISNALYLRDRYRNTRIVVHSDCCAGTTEQAHKAALDIMKNCCICITT